MDDEIIEALHEFSSQLKIIEISFLETNDHSHHASTPYFLEDKIDLHPNNQVISHEVIKVVQPCLYFKDQEHKKYFKQEKET